MRSACRRCAIGALIVRNPSCSIRISSAWRLRGKHADTRERVVSKLEKTPIIIPRFAYERKVKYGEWIKNLGNIDLWGLRADAEAVLAAWPDGFDLERLLDSGAKPGPVFKKFQDQVMARKLALSGITLSVIDEIHNWKNGGNGAEDFAHRFAPSIERKLILSATPFQIEEGELRKVFAYASGTASSPSLAIVDQILADSGPAKACLAASNAFRAAWEGLRKEDLLALNSVLVGAAHTEPAGLDSAFPKADRTETLDKLLGTVTHYHDAIQSLQAVLKRLIIRHTKNRDKRHFHSGHEFAVSGRPDYGKARQSLYETAGFGKPDNALISFLGMRVDQLIRRDADKAGAKPKAHLLGGITSSFSAFRESNTQLTSDKSGLSEYTRGHLRFFERALGSGKHPKVEATVQRALENYLRGHKTLIFCERLATLAEIKSELDEGLHRTVFNSISQDTAKGIRKLWLARHKDVEFYWHASYILLNGPETAREMSASVKRSWNAILARMHEIAAGFRLPSQ